MNVFVSILLMLLISGVSEQKPKKAMLYNQLNEFEKFVILKKGTERPYTGEYYKLMDKELKFCVLIAGVIWDMFSLEKALLKRIQDIVLIQFHFCLHLI